MQVSFNINNSDQAFFMCLVKVTMSLLFPLLESSFARFKNYTVHLAYIKNELAWHNICWPHPFCVCVCVMINTSCVQIIKCFKFAFWSVCIKDLCSTQVSCFKRQYNWVSFTSQISSSLCSFEAYHLCHVTLTSTCLAYCKHFMTFGLCVHLFMSAFFLEYYSEQKKAKNKACVLFLGRSDHFWTCLNY